MKGLRRSMKRGGQNLYEDAVYLFVSKSGDDAKGNGTIGSPFLTITQAFAQVTTARTKIFVFSGVYDEAAAMSWPTYDNVELIGIGTVIISAAGTTQIIDITPGALTETFDAKMENIYLDHSNAGQDGILIDNTDTTKKIILTLKDVGGDNDAGVGGDMIATVHADTSNAIRIYWDGDGGNGVEGRVNYTTADGGDRVYISNCWLAGGLNTSVTDIATDLRLRNCVIKHEGITGGHSTQTLDIVNCYSETAGTFAAADADDVQGDQTETIV